MRDYGLTARALYSDNATVHELRQQGTKSCQSTSLLTYHWSLRCVLQKSAKPFTFAHHIPMNVPIYFHVYLYIPRLGNIFPCILIYPLPGQCVHSQYVMYAISFAFWLTFIFSAEQSHCVQPRLRSDSARHCVLAWCSTGGAVGYPHCGSFATANHDTQGV